MTLLRFPSLIYVVNGEPAPFHLVTLASQGLSILDWVLCKGQEIEGAEIWGPSQERHTLECSSCRTVKALNLTCKAPSPCRHQVDLPPAHRLPSQSITVGVVGGAEEVVSSFSSGVTLPSLEVGEMFSQGTSVGI